MKELIDRFIALTEEKRDLNEDLRVLNEELERVEQMLADEFLQQGLKNIKTDQGQTIYLKDQVFASAEGTTEELCEVLKKDQKTEWLVKETVHGGQLSAWVRERLREGGLPENLKPHIKVTETKKLGVQNV